MAADWSKYQDHLYRVAIVRDPRDTIISSTLFRFNRLKLLNNEKLVSHLISLFEQKENDPRSISVHDILEAAEEGEAQDMKDSFGGLLTRYSNYLDQEDQHVLLFDQMVAGDFAAINDYLGLTLLPPPPLEGWVSKISRKGTSGDWKNWFTPADVAFFRPAMDPFIKKYGFPPEWVLGDEPLIEPKYCSQYITRLSEARKVDPNLRSDVGSDMGSLLSAAEDGKVNALMKLVTIYEAEDNAEEVLKHSMFLADMGDAKYMVKTARILIKMRKLDMAYDYLWRGVALNYRPAFFFLGNQYLRPINSGKYEEGMTLLKKGASLGSKKCKVKLKALVQKNGG